MYEGLKGILAENRTELKTVSDRTNSILHDQTRVISSLNDTKGELRIGISELLAMITILKR